LRRGSVTVSTPFTMLMAFLMSFIIDMSLTFTSNIPSWG
jgi:hypothetical protein